VMQARKLFREPLFHFLLLGAAIFAAYSFTTRHNAKQDEIVITQGKIDSIIATFERTWQHQPSQQEVQGLIRDYVREEASYREAMAMGLDQDDQVIRRRLRQKLEFFSEDTIAQAQPTEAELESYLKTHQEKFKTDATFTFRQVYLNAQKRGANLQHDTERMLSSLQQAGANADLSAYGDTSLLEEQYDNFSAIDVKKTFGEEFEKNLTALSPGNWQGPVASSYGEHLVFVIKKQEEVVPPLAQIRDAVAREWGNARRTKANDDLYQALLERYTVRIEEPKEKQLA
jgi:PPIC-type PPIASE domain